MIESVQRLLAEPIPLGGVLTLFSGLVAALWTWHVNRAQERKRYTFDVVMRYASSPDLLRALDEVNRVMSGGRASGSADALERSMALLLPYFQSIALAANQGMLDREVVLKARYGTMKAVWDHFSADIAAKRVALGRPLLYCDLEAYLADNERRYKRYQQRQVKNRAATAS